MPDDETTGDGSEEEAPASQDAKAEEPQADAEAAAEPEPQVGGIADLFRAALPDVEFEATQGLSDIIIAIKPDDVPKVMPVARDDPSLDLKFLRCLFGVDLEDEGMDVVYQLMSLEKGHEVVLKARLPKDKLKVASVSEVWHAADWHERETRDMFGIEFEGHPHLIPLLLPEDMTDHFPLRKENVLAEIEEWQADLLGEDGNGASGNGGGEE